MLITQISCQHAGDKEICLIFDDDCFLVPNQEQSRKDKIHIRMVVTFVCTFKFSQTFSSLICYFKVFTFLWWSGLLNSVTRLNAGSKTKCSSDNWNNFGEILERFSKMGQKRDKEVSKNILKYQRLKLIVSTVAKNQKVALGCT